MKKRYVSFTFSKWVVPYICIILVPVLFGVALYHQALQTVKRDIELIQEQSLGQIQQKMDEMQIDLQMAGYSISYSMEADSLKSFVGEGYSVKQISNSRAMLDDFATYQATHDEISDIVAYFPGTGYVLKNGRFCPLLWAEPFLPVEYGITGEEIREAAKEGQGGLRIGKLQGGEIPLYLYISGTEQKQGTQVLLLFTLDTGYLKKILAAGGVQAYFKMEDGTTWQEPALLRMPDLEKQYSVRSLSCWEGEVSLVSLLSIREYRRTVDVMQRLLVGYLVGGILLGVAGVWFVTRRNYRPVRELREMTSHVYGNDNIRDDVEAVRFAYENLNRAYKEGKTLLRQSQEDGNNGKMNRLLKRRPDVRGNRPPTGWEKKCPGEWFLLLSVEILDFADFAEADGTLTSPMMETAYFAVGNVLAELLQKQGRHFVGAETDGKWFLLLNGSERDGAKGWMEREAAEVASHLKQFLQEELNMPVSIDISEVHTGWDSVRLCYQELEELREYRSFVGMAEQEIARYASCQNERRIEAAPKPKPIRKEAKRQMPQEHIAGGTGAASKSDMTTAGSTATIEQVVAFIEEHYQENTLTVGALAEQFNMGLSWLSRSFKTAKGIGILEYINRLRLSQAKKMIREGMPIKEVAVAVGYTDTQPLNRMFRQLVGMTPTEYRNCAGKEKNDR